MSSALLEDLHAFVDEVIAVEHDLVQYSGDITSEFQEPETLTELRRKARERGLWNLHFVSPDEPRIRPSLEFLPIAIELGRSRFAAIATNSIGPDSGNMDLLACFGTDEQRERYLEPLLRGDIRSCFAMTEPAVASSDARNIEATIAVDGDRVTVTGRKWWITQAGDPNCRVALVVGKTEWPGNESDGKHSVVLVPLPHPNVRVIRRLEVFGYLEDHAEIEFDGVEVTTADFLGAPGRGLAIAQERLIGARLQHCMRMVGLSERALEVAIERSASRTAFRQRISDMPVTQGHFADMRVAIESARGLVRCAAEKVDAYGLANAKIEASIAKIGVPRLALEVVDRAMQICGGVGLSDDLPLALLSAHARVIRTADGPEDVHRMVVGRAESARERV